ncbi:hypothetical protein [Rosenbergiella epipactidis]|uniref:hypothetical protein n=1 Tax=Rosenbergiella epipactidis TaxID=1544694 RepID=UPI001F4D842D|nr:hypothetical protein [Rosenbergiella epipactidis]
MKTTRTKRVYWKDIADICVQYQSAVIQHPQSRSMTYVAKSGHSVWVINKETGKVIKKLSELTLEEWEIHINEMQVTIDLQKT